MCYTITNNRMETINRMKPYYIKDLKPDEGHRIDDRYLVKTADIRDGNNGKRHLYMSLADATGDIQSV